MWDLYWAGNPSEGYAPYRKLRGFDLTTKKDRVLLSKAKTVVKCIAEQHPHHVLTASQIMELNTHDRDQYFEQAFVQLFKSYYPNQDLELMEQYRVGQLSYATFYDAL